MSLTGWTHIALVIILLTLVLDFTRGPYGVRQTECDRPYVLVSVNLQRAQLSGLIDAETVQTDQQQLLLDVVAWRLKTCGITANISWVDGNVLRVQNLSSSEERNRVARLLKSIGLCELLLVAEPGDLNGGTEELYAEKKRFEDWRGTSPCLPFSLYNSDPIRADPRLAWFPMRKEPEKPGLVVLPGSLSEHFGAADFARIIADKDQFGRPALRWVLQEERAGDLSSMLEMASKREPDKSRRLAVVVRGKIQSMPLVSSIGASGLIEGLEDNDEYFETLEALDTLQGPFLPQEVK